MNDPLDLDAIEQRVRAASPGPWKWAGPWDGGTDQALEHRPVGPMGLYGHDRRVAYQLVSARGWVFAPALFPGRLSPAEAAEAGVSPDAPLDVLVIERADAEFIARAREDIPALIAEIRRLRGD